MRRSVYIGFLMIVFGVVAPLAKAQRKPWEEYSKHISGAQNVDSLSGDLFGDSVALYTGRVSFRHVDIEIPGNSSLPVRLARTFQVRDPAIVSAFSWLDSPSHDELLADWELDVPRISGTFGHHLNGPVLGSGGLELNPGGVTLAWSDQRCSGARVPPPIGEFFAVDYWGGLQAQIESGGEMLQPNSGVQLPASGGPYRWLTPSLTWFSCLSQIKNGTGEGFFAISPDGTKYWFDWMAKVHEPTLRKQFYYSISTPTDGYEEFFEQILDRRKNTLYATRVEDRFGNWVSYTYTNAPNERPRIGKIESNDGRLITFTYDASGRLASASAHGRTWQYTYGGNPARLTGVLRPDGSKWAFNFGTIPYEYNTLEQGPGSCSYPGELGSVDFDDSTLRMTHPSGAQGEFTFRLRLHGRSNVPRQCVAVPDGNGPENGAYSDYVRMYWTRSLVKKRVFGPGIPESAWNYSYNSAQTPAQARSGFTQNYSAPGSWASPPYVFTSIPEEGKPITDLATYRIIEPVCTSDGCAGRTSTEVTGPGGTWSRYTFGNSYRYDEGLVLRVELGSSASHILRTEFYNYQLSSIGQPYPAKLGISRQYKGDGLNSTVLRPQKVKRIVQDGAELVNEVEQFDSLGRSTRVRKSSVPAVP